MSARVWAVLHLLVLALPALGLFTRRIPDARLYGVEVEPRPRLALDAWIAEQAQPAIAAWVESHVALRGALVRTDNTLFEALSGQSAPTSQVDYGASGTLFLKEDLEFFSKAPSELPAEARIGAQADRIREVQAILTERGRRLVVVYAPVKTSVYREDVPARWRRAAHPPPSDARVHDIYVRTARERGAEIVDGREVIAQAEAPREEVFSKLGVHWTDYGACLVLKAADALPFTGCPYAVREVDWLGSTHFDLDRMRNGWSPRARASVAPVLEPRPSPVSPRPRVLFIGTSFTWMLAEAVRSLAISARVAYYYDTFYEVGDGGRHPRAGVVRGTKEWRDLLLDADVYVLDLLERHVPAPHVDAFLADISEASGLLSPVPPSVCRTLSWCARDVLR